MTHPMNTPITALEECLRLAELATPGEWSPFQRNRFMDEGLDERVLHQVQRDDGANIAMVTIYSREADGPLIASAINLLRTHGKALSEALGGWEPIEKIPDDECVLIVYEATELNEVYKCHEQFGREVIARYVSESGTICDYSTWQPVPRNEMWRPILWRPLPPPPTSAKGSNGVPGYGGVPIDFDDPELRQW